MYNIIRIEFFLILFFFSNNNIIFLSRYLCFNSPWDKLLTLNKFIRLFWNITFVLFLTSQMDVQSLKMVEIVDVIMKNYLKTLFNKICDKFTYSFLIMRCKQKFCAIRPSYKSIFWEKNTYSWSNTDEPNRRNCIIAGFIIITKKLVISHKYWSTYMYT